MAVEVYRFVVTIPAGTPASAPVAFPLVMPSREVEEVEIVVPPGPRGEVGFQLGQGSTQMLPTNPGAYIVADDEVIHWPLEDQIDSGSWSMIAYNTGQFNHSIEVRFLVRLVDAQAARPLLVIPNEALAG